jgi:hypothetical protein
MFSAVFDLCSLTFGAREDGSFQLSLRPLVHDSQSPRHNYLSDMISRESLTNAYCFCAIGQPPNCPSADSFAIDRSSPDPIALENVESLSGPLLIAGGQQITKPRLGLSDTVCFSLRLTMTIGCQRYDCYGCPDESSQVPGFRSFVWYIFDYYAHELALQ